MWFHQNAAFWAILRLVYTAIEATTESAEYCQWETFHAVCAENEVILMTKALYGRMEYGRCVKRDYGYVGCLTDGLTLADRRCSGRQTCQIGVPDKLFDGTRPCPEDLKLYMEATYQCVRVSVPNRQRCVSGDPVPVVVSARHPKGLLSSAITEKTGCGSTGAPWLLSARPGQRLNLTLMDFARARQNETRLTSTDGRPSYSHCLVYAIIKERGLAKSMTVCGGNPSKDRVREVYLSDSHQLEVRIVTGKTMQEYGHFLLQYEAIGCPDPGTPRGGWMKRKGQTATAGCHDSTKVWHLTCREHNWVGALNNCSNSGFHAGLSSMTNMPHAASMFIVLGVAVVIGILILLIGLVLLKRCVFRRQTLAKGNNNLQVVPPQKPKMSGKEPLYMSTGNNMEYTHPPLLNRQDPFNAEENEYAYVEEFQFSAPGSCACINENTFVQNNSRTEAGMTMNPYGLMANESRHVSLKSSKGTGSHGDQSHLGYNRNDDSARNCPADYFTLEPDEKDLTFTL